MNKRLQTLNIQLTGADKPVHQDFAIQLDKAFPFCTGIAVIDSGINNIANSDNVQLAIEDETGRVFDFAPLAVWQQANTLNKSEIFRRVLLRAGSNWVRVLVKADKLATGDSLKFDVVFRLSQSETLVEKTDFQVKRVVVANRSAGLKSETNLVLKSDFETVNGIGIVCPNPENFFLEVKDNTNILVNRVRGNVLSINPGQVHSDRFFPVNNMAQGQEITLVVENDIDIPVDKNILDVVFQLSND